MRVSRLVVCCAAALCVMAGWASLADAQESPPVSAPAGRIDVVQVNGLLDPSNAALIRSSLRDAERVHSTVLVYQIDGSGAVDVDVPSLVHLFETTSVPVAAWVGPSGGGARGASALLALKSGYAALASGAHFGPVNPVSYDRSGPHFTEGRITERSPTLQDFVASLDGRTINGVRVATLKGPPGHRTLSQDVHFHKLDLGQQLAHTLDTPWVAYFLFVVGLLLIVFEFFTASIAIAGAVGAIALVGGCFGFSHLPVTWWAVALLLVGVLGLAIDVQAGGLGAWTFIGSAALIAGSVWLYGGSAHLDPRWWVLVLVIGGAILFMTQGMTAMVRARFSTPTVGREDLVGEMGLAEADIAPDGVVRVRDALWRARTNRATPIHAGDRVRVVSVEGIVLEVEPETGGARDYRERRRS